MCHRSSRPRLAAVGRALAPLLLALVTSFPAAAVRAREKVAALDTAAIERLTGEHGTLDAASGVFRIALPRTDVSVHVGGIALTPRQGLAGWLAFQRAVDGSVLLMGDLVLVGGELDAVVSAALDAGLDVTGIHNHFVGEEPRLVYVHLGGHGAPETVATAAGKVLQALAAAHGRTLPAPAAGGGAALDAKLLDELLGTHGEASDGVYRATFGETASMHGELVGTPMGVATWTAFAGSGAHAVVDGDFAMHEPEVRPVLVALRQGGISVVALHSHMVGEQPRIAFLHYWGTGPAEELAKTLRAALDAQRRARDAAERH